MRFVKVCFRISVNAVKALDLSHDMFNVHIVARINSSDSIDEPNLPTLHFSTA